MITRKAKVVGVLASVLFLGSSTVLVFIWGYVQTKGIALSEQSVEVANFNAREQKYRELEQLISATALEREELISFLLTEEKTIDFLSSVEEIALEQNVELTTDSLRVIEDKGLFDSLQISFALKGEKDRVYALLSIFETLPYHGSVSKIAFNNKEQEGVDWIDGTVELTVSLLKYDR